MSEYYEELQKQLASAREQIESLKSQKDKAETREREARDAYNKKIWEADFETKCLVTLAYFRYDDLESSLAKLMERLCNLFEADSVALFRKRGAKPFTPLASKGDCHYCQGYINYHSDEIVKGTNVDLSLMDGINIKVFNFAPEALDGEEKSYYSFGILNSKKYRNEYYSLIYLTLRSIIANIEPLIIRRSIDKMSNVYNRDEYERRIEELKADKDSYVAVSFVDIFSLKRVNDNYGHPVGDAYIKAVANALKKYIGSLFNDINGTEIFRVGGDEFLVLATSPNEEGSKKMSQIMKGKLDEAKQEIERLSVNITSYPEITSFDHGEFQGAAKDIESTLKVADDNMISAKREHYASIGDRRAKEKQQQQP